MHDSGLSFWGMFWEAHVLWWLFWIVVIVLFVFSISRVPRYRWRETPIDLLQSRHAAGEISTEQYEEQKAKLEHDAKLIK